MLIEFHNCEIDLAQLRTGIPIALSGSGDVVHVKRAVANIYKGEVSSIKLVVDHPTNGEQVFNSDYCVWLSPH